nr:ribonuclease H-like domain, reverse transcriptase, RNA-dependent DNA polymerase [Tanacetum cinerariifolium]
MKDSSLGCENGFLRGDLKEEVYVVQPEVFEKMGDGRRVYKLAKSLDGVRQDSKAWKIKLDNTLKEMGFQHCMQEKAIYRMVLNGEFTIVFIYVDELFVTETSLELINEFKKRVASQFEMLDLGELTYYLGVEVDQEKDCVKIKRERYAMKILKEAGVRNKK